MVILDTCALIELCKIKPSFSSRAMKTIATEAIILSISFAEIACKVKLGKLEMDVSPRDLYNKFTKVESFDFIDIDTDLWLASIELDWPENKDPADRLIVAYAARENLKIVTSDKSIKKFYQKIIW